jgi:hypothetical protein
VIPIPIEEIQFAGGNGHKILDIKTNIIYMKKLKLILSISLIALFFGCSEENNDVDLDGIDAPSNITTITQDNSGMLLFFAKGEELRNLKFIMVMELLRGFVNLEESISKYKEGKFQAKIVGITINGKKTETIQR